MVGCEKYLPPAYVVRRKVMFILGNVCLPTLDGGVPTLDEGTYLGWGYLPWMRGGGYIPWMGGIYPGLGGTHPGWGYLAWMGGGTYFR